MDHCRGVHHTSEDLSLSAMRQVSCRQKTQRNTPLGLCPQSSQSPTERAAVMPGNLAAAGPDWKWPMEWPAEFTEGMSPEQLAVMEW